MEDEVLVLVSGCLGRVVVVILGAVSFVVRGGWLFVSLVEQSQCHNWYGLVLLGCSSWCGPEGSCVLTREGELF